MRRRDWAGTVLDLLDHRWLNRAGNLGFLAGLVWSAWGFIGSNPVNTAAVVLMAVGIVLMAAPKVRARLHHGLSRERVHRHEHGESARSTPAERKRQPPTETSKPAGKFDAELRALLTHGRSVSDGYLSRQGLPSMDSAARDEHLRWTRDAIEMLRQRDDAAAERFEAAPSHQERMAILADLLGNEEE